jgi:pimeloyl-ACP methyl ester carboxylesterase
MSFNHGGDQPWWHVTRGGIKIAYYLQGAGEPLVLIRGYGNAASMWYHQVAALSRAFQVITFDNRDTGNSDRVAEPYVISDLAEDTLSLIESLNLGPVHLAGLSMGGMIAMEASLKKPSLVKSLILAGTACNADRGLTSDPEILALFATLPELSDEENVRRSLPAFFSALTLEDKPFLDDYLGRSLAQRPPLTTFLRHSQAMQGFDCCDRLSQLSVPTLIQHGGADRLLPVENAFWLREKISDARLVIYGGLGHLFLMEDPGTCNADLQFFVQQASALHP